MNIEEKVMLGFWNLFQKRVWLDEYFMKSSLKGFTPSEIHCIEYVGRTKDVNVTELAEAFYMTRSAISKLTKKLIEKQLIERYQKPDNKKEMYFTLTEKGKKIDRIHKELHREFKERDRAVFEGTSIEQFEAMLHFSEEYNEHLDKEIEKLGVDITSGYMDKM